MLGQITTQLAELRRAELLAEATSHRSARTRTTPSAPTRLWTAVAARSPRRRSSVDVDVVPATCCAAA